MKNLFIAGFDPDAIDNRAERASTVPGPLVGLRLSNLLPPPHPDPANPRLDHWIHHRSCFGKLDPFALSVKLVLFLSKYLSIWAYQSLV